MTKEDNEFHINNLVKKLEKNNYDGMLLTDFNNIRYISGYLPTSFAFAVLKENPISNSYFSFPPSRFKSVFNNSSSDSKSIFPSITVSGKSSAIFLPYSIGVLNGLVKFLDTSNAKLVLLVL